MKRSQKEYVHGIEFELRIAGNFQSLYNLAYLLVDIGSAVAIAQRLHEGKPFAKKRNIYTSRRTIESYRDVLQLKQLSGGSLLAAIAATVIGGVVVLYIERATTARQGRNITINVTNMHIHLSEEDKRHFRTIIDRNYTGNPRVDLPTVISASQAAGFLPAAVDQHGVEYLTQTIERLLGIGENIDYHA